MVYETIRKTGNRRTVVRQVAPITVGAWAGQAANEAEIPALAALLGRPAQGHLLHVEEEEVVAFVDDGSQQCPREVRSWRTVRQWRTQ